ncbi:RDD family protein [Neisseria montereyensis]|uniref:RDD family protein n=1 Tax=Neisseria montereyensis TaxID=2973938 RepID=A0ABT2FDF8_9NEIS|nr:RDD family protein [Neisseria montereyensis]MCS4533990.1 RDD family protein [Neisseria montereyensis]
MNEIYTNNAISQSFETEVVVEPASAGSRIAAYCLNILFTFIASLPLIITIGYSLEDFLGSTKVTVYDQSSFNQMAVVGLVILLAYAIIQVIMMSKSGQSLGKKVMKIRVLKTDGTNPGFGGTVLIREIGFNFILSLGCTLISKILVLAIGGDDELTEGISSLLSMIVWLVCFIMLFNLSKDRRTLQDYLANTVVVKLPDNR